MTRRTWLEWIGKATVISLGADLLAACTRRLAHPVDASSAPDPCSAEAADSSLPFAPGDGNLDIYSGWPERTVDRQDLEGILSSWTLTIDGLVDTEQVLSFASLLCLERLDQVKDLHCVEGWSVLDVPWSGVHLRTLLDLAHPLPGATHATFHTLGGRYNESLPLEIALEPSTLLAYGVGGATLPLEHGFPLRLVVPRLYAYKSAKYVQRVEITDHAVEGYWVSAGYPYLGDVPADRLRPGKY